MLDFSDTKSDRTPDRTSISRANTRSPIRRPVRLCVQLIAVNQAIDSMQPPGIQIILIFKRTDLSCKRNYEVDGRRQGIYAYKMLKWRRRRDSRRTVNVVLVTLRLRN
jgi:hypothetical protein